MKMVRLPYWGSLRRAPESDYIFVMNFTEKKQLITVESLVNDLVTVEDVRGEEYLRKRNTKLSGSEGPLFGII